MTCGLALTDRAGIPVNTGREMQRQGQALAATCWWGKQARYEMNPDKTVIGDWVRPADSSVSDVGCVVGTRTGEYLIVEWDNGVTTTHRRDSMESVPAAPMHPLALRELD